jgi:gamma-glutamylputrescine oxidase
VAPGVLSVAGYSGHGVALATLAGKLMAEAVQGTAGRFDVFASLPQPPFPGGVALRAPLLALAMGWYALRDRL